MAADQERADRIRELKKQHPEYTWQAIADHVGVSLRAAQSWQEKGGIDYENAKKLAALWGEDLDFIMRGPRSDPPALMDRFSRRQGDQAIVEALASIDERLTKIENELRRRAIEAPTPELPGELGRYEPDDADTPANQTRRKTG
jgi:hypothetical protein